MAESPNQLEIDEACQRYIQAWRDGSASSVEEFAEEYPHLADEIRKLLPTMIFAEQLNPRIESETFQEVEVPGELGPFELHREIGRGGMGVVYEASQSDLSHPLAVKVLHNFAHPTQNLTDRFVREAETASRLHHAHIVPPRQYGATESFHYLAMALIDGVSLDRLIRNEEVFADTDPILNVFENLVSSPKQVAIVGSHVASALSHAHENGMVHRDIKPANLILDRKGCIWVTDFGLAKLFDEEDDLSRTGELIGTPRYMAPEQLVGLADERSDIYGIGVTLYELVTRRRPWAEHRRKSDEGSILQVPDVRKYAPELPDRLADIIMKACQHHPEARYQTARALEFELNDFAFGGAADRRNETRARSQIPFPFSTGLAATAVVLLAGWILSSMFFAKPSPVPPHSPPPLSSEESEYEPPKTNCISFIDPATNYHQVIVKVCNREDDAEEYGAGTMYLDSTDLELTWDEEYQLVGLRFDGVEIPAGATIKSARIEFESYSTAIAESNLEIFGIDDANPISFRPIDYDLTNRPRTAERVTWTPEAWERGAIERTPECTALVQAIVSKPDWQEGNAIGFIIDGKGHRRAGAYDDNIHSAASLVVQFELQTIN